MSEQELDFLGRTVKGTPDPAEIRLIAELKDCHEDSLSKRHAVSHPPQSVLADGHKELVQTAEAAQAKVETVKVKLKDYRRAKLRKKDRHDLSGLRIGLNDLAGEFEGIFCDNDLYRERFEHSAEATTVYQQHWTRLQTIREKLGRLKLVMNSVDGNADLCTAVLQRRLGK
jgi:hypothetical protein